MSSPNNKPETKMHADNEPVTHDMEIFSATLTPYRSMPSHGFILMMILFGGTCFICGFFYLKLGAWPVLGFFGLDVLTLFVAFKINYRRAKAFEEILIQRDRIIIRRVNPKGRATELRFNPFWTKMELVKDDEGVVRQISIRTKGETTKIGTFLNPADKTSFAKAFGAALHEARA